MIYTAEPVAEETVQELAERQAALDAQLLEKLREVAKRTGDNFVGPDGEEPESIFVDAEEALEPPRLMNRADRRQAVAQFKENLRHLPRQKPVVNPTIRPRKRR